eukprot:493754-Pleurochrysis_carterae.AAC.2
MAWKWKHHNYDMTVTIPCYSQLTTAIKQNHYTALRTCRDLLACSRAMIQRACNEGDCVVAASSSTSQIYRVSMVHEICGKSMDHASTRMHQTVHPNKCEMRRQD